MFAAAIVTPGMLKTVGLGKKLQWHFTPSDGSLAAIEVNEAAYAAWNQPEMRKGASQCALFYLT
jgi:hypothetical protein